MVTNDIEGLAVGASTYAAMLTAKGAMVGDARVVKRESELLVETNAGQGEAVAAFLNSFLISEEAEVVPAPELAVLGFLGPNAQALLEQFASGRLGTLTGMVPGGVDAVVPREALPALLKALEAVPQVDAQTYEVLRVEAGVPFFGADMTATTIPLEANLERAIHYNKGCYIGQEVIARATYRGKMNRKLTGLLLGALVPERGVELKLGEKKVGWLTSVVQSQLKGQTVALGYVHRDSLAPGTVLEVASGGTATVAALPLA
jgi:folate-binding protein YgfZ